MKHRGKEGIPDTRPNLPMLNRGLLQLKMKTEDLLGERILGALNKPGLTRFDAIEENEVTRTPLTVFALNKGAQEVI